MVKTSRLFFIVLLFAVILAVGADASFAADDNWNIILRKDFRGPGDYLSWVKIIACWLVFVAWVYTTDWLSTDCQDLKLNYLRWNPVVFGSFMAAFMLVWLIPLFWIGFPLLLAAYIAPFATYVVTRNRRVDNDRQVLTREHLRYWLAVNLGKVGVKIAAQRRDPREGGPVQLFGRGGVDEQTNNARLLSAKRSSGFILARQILAECLDARGSAVMLDYTQQGVAMRIMIDGVWIPTPDRQRDAGDPALEAIKLLCGLNPQNRQSRQEGMFSIQHETVRYAATFVSQGTSGGERALVQFEDRKIHFKTLDDLGMRAKLQERLKELLQVQRGLVLFSAPPGGGLRSTMDVALNVCDRYVREFAALEEENRSYQPVENVPVTTYSTASGQSPVDVLPSLFRKEPDVVVVRDLVSAQTVSLLCQQVAKDRLIIGSIRAKDAAEALLRVLALGVPAAEFAEAVTAVVSQRLVRRLCDTCKEAYAPTPQMLQQLGIPAGRVQAFYRPPQPNPEQKKEPCQVCGAIGYLGRTAIFEILTVGDAVRKELAAGAQIDRLRKAARKDGMKTFQEEGILLIARGVTSLPELTRALKQ